MGLPAVLRVFLISAGFEFLGPICSPSEFQHDPLNSIKSPSAGNSLINLARRRLLTL